ncbi:MAG: peptidylprolyl isomerase [Phycisphaerales bacterium]|nr:peptidylprolyl isomerase [Phycisphaerales bacterium]
MVEVQADAPHTTLTLVLLTHDGALLGQASDVAAGRIDLAELFPLPELRRAAWLQLLVDGIAQGTPLIVQPLIGRPPIRTTESIRPDGTTRYTRIVGWGDVLIDPTNPDDEALRATWAPGEPTPWSGVRVYPDEVVVLETDHGDIRVALRPDEAPNTAWNFRQLVESGLYGGTTFHRVVPFDRTGRPFVIQGGDPTGTGDGGPGYDLPIEPSRLRHDFGVISMARADDPDSAGSQFFFCLSREGTARLDGQYCAFGEAIGGAETILSIASGSIADPATGRPDEPARILNAKLVPALPHVPGLGRAEHRIERPKAPEDEPLTPSGHAPR